MMMFNFLLLFSCLRVTRLSECTSVDRVKAVAEKKKKKLEDERARTSFFCLCVLVGRNQEEATKNIASFLL